MGKFPYLQLIIFFLSLAPSIEFSLKRKAFSSDENIRRQFVFQLIFFCLMFHGLPFHSPPASLFHTNVCLSKLLLSFEWWINHDSPNYFVSSVKIFIKYIKSLTVKMATDSAFVRGVIKTVVQIRSFYRKAFNEYLMLIMFVRIWMNWTFHASCSNCQSRSGKTWLTNLKADTKNENSFALHKHFKARKSSCKQIEDSKTLHRILCWTENQVKQTEQISWQEIPVQETFIKI